MTSLSRAKIQALWCFRPEEINYKPATRDELLDFEDTHKTIPKDYRWFLETCGSGVVGSEWLDGIDDLFYSHQKFNEELNSEDGWTTKELFVIGWDGAGCPIGIMPSGEIVVEYPNEGKPTTLSKDLETYILAGLEE